jgi:hypothetical protein
MSEIRLIVASYYRFGVPACAGNEVSCYPNRVMN